MKNMNNIISKLFLRKKQTISDVLSGDEQLLIKSVISEMEELLEIKCPTINISKADEFSYYDEETDTIVLVKREFGEMRGDIIHEMRHVWQHVHGKGTYFDNYHERDFFDNVEDYMSQPEEVDAIAFSLVVLNAYTEQNFFPYGIYSGQFENIIHNRIDELLTDKRIYMFYMEHIN